MSIKPSERLAGHARTLPREVYDLFKTAMFQIALKIRQGEIHDMKAAFALAIVDTADRKTVLEMTGLWMWYREFYLPRKYRWMLALIRGHMPLRKHN